MGNDIVIEDMGYIFNQLSAEQKGSFKESTVLITGCAGFLGYYFMHFLASFQHELSIKRVIGIDNFMLRKPKWIAQLSANNSSVEIFDHDIVRGDISKIQNVSDADFVIHMASIASPTYYRKYPIETLDANVWGLRKLLEYYKEKKSRGFLFFSSSEVYGDPPSAFIPTAEDYNGNVSCVGPRSCYDEAKRFGETLCYLFAQQYGMPITIVRPFNNFGPGMNLNDKRVPADFARSVFEGRDIEMYSDGTPTRTFCYVADAVAGYLKALTYGKFDCFNIGIAEPEISIKELADIYVNMSQRLFGYKGTARFAPPPEAEYLTHNPNRRCPMIEKAAALLDYRPSISVEEGVRRFLEFVAITGGEQ